MKHLTVTKTELPADRILANWANTAMFIYDAVATTEDLKALLRHEVLNKGREMIVERLKIRLLSMMKYDTKCELEKEIIELEEGIRKDDGDIPTDSD